MAALPPRRPPADQGVALVARLRRVHESRGPARSSTARTRPAGSSSRAATCASAAPGRSPSARRALELYHHRHVFKAIERPRRILMTTTETRLDGSRFVTSMPSSRSKPATGHADDHDQAGFPTDALRDRARAAGCRTRLPLAAAAGKESACPRPSCTCRCRSTGSSPGPTTGRPWPRRRRRRSARLARRLASAAPRGFDPPGPSEPDLRRGDGDRTRSLVGRRTFDYRGALERRSPRRADLRARREARRRRRSRTGSTT